MKFALVTGSAGLIGMETSIFMNKGFKVIGIDNDSRKKFFGHDASVSKNINQLLEFAKHYL